MQINSRASEGKQKNHFSEYSTCSSHVYKPWKVSTLWYGDALWKETEMYPSNHGIPAVLPVPPTGEGVRQAASSASLSWQTPDALNTASFPTEEPCELSCSWELWGLFTCMALEDAGWRKHCETPAKALQSTGLSHSDALQRVLLCCRRSSSMSSSFFLLISIAETHTTVWKNHSPVNVHNVGLRDPCENHSCNTKFYVLLMLQ